MATFGGPFPGALVVLVVRLLALFGTYSREDIGRGGHEQCGRAKAPATQE
jgi:hypothetical protein